MNNEHTNSVDYVSDGVSSTGFNIAVNGTMFQMLTSNVYSKPKLAVVREWSTNACDACIEAEKEVNFDVHLPTSENPTFSVRDYGSGLSPEDVVGLFSTLGASTKRNSDKLNGCFGIGRMAGLAVADAFTVESFYEGKHYSYAISMENGEPITLNFGVVDTEEENGLKLSVAVSAEDVAIYKEIASELYRYFDYKPNLNYELDISSKQGLFRNDDWYVEKSDLSHWRYATNKVILSQVVYEIPNSSDIDMKGLSNIIIKAPPGSVSFNPGRESLSLDKKTVTYLNNMFNKITKDFYKQASDVLDLSTNDVDTVKAYYDMVRAGNNHLVPFDLVSDRVSDKLRSLLYAGSSVAMDEDFYTNTSNSVVLNIKTTHYKTSRVLERSNSVGLSTFMSAKHIIVDVKTNFKSSLFDHFANENFVMWQRPKNADLDTAVEKSKEYLESIGLPYILASSVITAGPTTRTQTREGLYVSKIGYNGAVNTSFKLANDDATTGTYLYVKLKHTTPQLSGDIPLSTYTRLHYKISQKTAVPKIFGVPKKYQKYVEELDNWLDLEEYMKDLTKTVSFYSETDLILPVKRLTSNNLKDPNLFPTDIKNFLLTNREYNKFIDTSKEFLNKYEDIEGYKKLGVTVIPYNPWSQDELDALSNKYPNTLELITDGSSWYNAIPDSVSSAIAKLEHDYFEIRKTMQ